MAPGMFHHHFELCYTKSVRSSSLLMAIRITELPRLHPVDRQPTIQ
jgi:hypothetical protein